MQQQAARTAGLEMAALPSAVRRKATWVTSSAAISVARACDAKQAICETLLAFCNQFGGSFGGDRAWLRIANRMFSEAET